jgi:hypothetical protein
MWLIKRLFELRLRKFQGFKILYQFEEFINPAVEESMDNDEDITEAIIETYSRDQDDEVEEEGRRE